jgi:hypothetical protein
VAVASIQPAAVVYREEQNFDWRAYAAIVAVEVAVTLGLYGCYRHFPEFSALALTLSAMASLGCLGMVVLLFRMTTEVTPTDVRVWFGWIPTYRRFVPVVSVQKIEVVSYRPLADYGGWGVRWGRDGERVLIARGNGGVRLHLADGTRVLIGSQRPESLAAAIERALRPGG